VETTQFWSMGIGYRVAYVKVNIAEDYDSGVIGA
jgi:hypothetical protein